MLRRCKANQTVSPQNEWPVVLRAYGFRSSLPSTFRSCKEAYTILEKLRQFTSRSVFKEQLKTKYEAILRQYENELTTVETSFLVSTNPFPLDRRTARPVLGGTGRIVSKDAHIYNVPPLFGRKLGHRPRRYRTAVSTDANARFRPIRG